MFIPDVSYEYYFSTYCRGREGVLSPSDFEFYISRASEEVGLRITQAADTAHLDLIRNAICETAEHIFTSGTAQNIKSETIDGYSVTYKDTASLQNTVSQIVEKHLSLSGLLYRGV